MSAIWFVAKDVLTATWSMPTKRLMGIFLRLSVVVGVIMMGVVLIERYVDYYSFTGSQIKETYRIYFGLQCASAYSDEQLLRHVNQYGNFDISKVGCADKVFWANLKEVRNLPKEPQLPDDRFGDYLNAHQVYGAVTIGAIWATIIVVLGLLLILVRRIAIWVIGTEQTR